MPRNSFKAPLNKFLVFLSADVTDEAVATPNGDQVRMAPQLLPIGSSTQPIEGAFVICEVTTSLKRHEAALLRQKLGVPFCPEAKTKAR